MGALLSGVPLALKCQVCNYRLVRRLSSAADRVHSSNRNEEACYLPGLPKTRGWRLDGRCVYPNSSPEQWKWFAKAKANAFGAGPSVTDDPSNPTDVVFKGGFYQTGKWSLIASWQNGEHRPRCFRGHRLAILEPDTMTHLLRKADEVGRAWIAIPE